MNINNSQFLSNLQIRENPLASKERLQNFVSNNTEVNFKDILQSKIDRSPEEVKFSKHANMRLENRNIKLSDVQIERLKEATVKAGEKGIKDSLVIVDDYAFIVNVPNNTVVTAVDKDDDNLIFTNIDGAVIA